MRIKCGVDCTAPELHLGHAVNLWMMRYLQDLGHTVVFLLGDTTTRIGDPTGRSMTRPVLTPEEIDRNAAAFLKQVIIVLSEDPQVFEAGQVGRPQALFGSAVQDLQARVVLRQPVGQLARPVWRSVVQDEDVGVVNRLSQPVQDRGQTLDLVVRRAPAPAHVGGRS